MKKILHLGAYDLNFGDNIALYNIRRVLFELDKTIKFDSFSIINFFENHNHIEYSKSIFEKWNDEYDMIIIGGGGLIEGGNCSSYATGYKLPFNKELMSVFNIPVVFFSVGINYFRGTKGLSDEGKKSLLETIESSTLFSVRDDGSMDILKSIYGNDIESKVYEIPDPGLIMPKDISVGDKVMFQPAMNNDIQQMKHRFNNSLDDLRRVIKQKEFDIYPHTLKDYVFAGESTDLNSKIIFSKTEFSDLVKFKNTLKSFDDYKNYKWGIVMRGHGQLVSFGLRLPCIYLVSQDKLKGFCEKYNLENYMVDTQSDNYLTELQEKINLMGDDSYVEEWYNIRDNHIHKIREMFYNFSKKVIHNI